MIASDIKVGQIIARRGLGKKNRRALLVETVTEQRSGIFYITGRSVRISDMVQTNRTVSVLHREGLGEVELLQDVPAEPATTTTTVKALVGAEPIQARRVAEIVDAAHTEALDMNAGRIPIYPKGTPEYAAYAQRLREELGKWTRREGVYAVGAEPIQARRVAAVNFTAADFVMVRETNGRTHIEAVAGVAAICGEPAVVIAGAVDLTLVDCLACADRYVVATRKACLTY